MKLFLINVLFIIPFFVKAQEESISKELTVAKCISLSVQYEKSGDIKEATRYLNSAAMIQWENKSYREAIGYFNQSIELNKRIGNASGIAKIESNLGMLYSDLRDFETSLNYFQKALEYRLAFGEKTEIISTYINKAVVLNSLVRYTEAALDLENALRLATEMNDAAQMKSCYGMLAETYEKAGDQEKTIRYFNLYRTFHEMVQLNRVNEAKKETEQARAKTLELELAEKEKELRLLIASRQLEEAHTNLENAGKELRSLMTGKTKLELANSLMERELELEKFRLEQAEFKNGRQKIWIALSIGGVVLLALLVTILYRNYRFKKQTNLKLADQNEEITNLNENLEAQVQNRTVELRKAMSKLERRNRDLDQFSHVISHNLRGPVANILGLGKVFNLTNSSDPVNSEIFGRLLVATRGLDSVVKDLSGILQVQDNQDIPRENLEFIPAMAEVKDLLRNEIEKSGAQIKVQIQTKTLKTVKPYFKSILYNLLSNAIKYQIKGNAPIIDVRTGNEDRAFVMIVSDNGVGIDSSNLELIFEAYKRLTLDGEGKGLGLYLTRAQVEALGGTIEVKSQIGKGTEFTIHLPQPE